MAATLSVIAEAAPANTGTDGREHLHTPIEKLNFPDFFGSDLWPQWKFPPRGLPWSPAKIEPAGPEQVHFEKKNFLIFSGSDVWAHWAFAHAGLLWSPEGLSNEGFTVKLLLNSGAFGYRSGALNNTNVLGRQSSITAMPGWRFKRENFEVTVFAGFDLQSFQLFPDDPESRLRGRHIGLRGGVELWYEPTPATMLAADASLSSIGAGNFARIAYGWRLLDRFYLGPEAQVYSTGSYSHTRVGVHITALKINEREWTGAIGLASDNDHRSGIYLRIGVLTRR